MERAGRDGATPAALGVRRMQASSSCPYHDGRGGDDVIGIGGNGAGGAPARLALEEELLYRVDLQGGGGGSGWTTTTGAERRERRAVKNRASAERSRARKQAYVHELEQEVLLLRAENDALRDECHELKAAAQEAVPAVKRTHQRASSAQF